MSIAWFYGPLLFPILTPYIETLEIKKALSFIILFLSFFLIIKFIGSTFSKITSVIGLKGVDRLLGLCFGALKVTAVLTSLFVFNLDFLETKQWWLDSLTREYTIKFAESAEPVFREWELGSSIFLNKDNLNLNL